jgi:uncharacterized protein
MLKWGMRPSLALEKNRAQVLLALRKYPVENLRVFGSAASGQDEDGSDLDLLIDARPGTGLQIFALAAELEKILEVNVDLVTSAGLHRSFRQKVLKEARPV